MSDPEKFLIGWVILAIANLVDAIWRLSRRRPREGSPVWVEVLFVAVIVGLVAKTPAARTWEVVAIPFTIIAFLAAMVVRLVARKRFPVLPR